MPSFSFAQVQPPETLEEAKEIGEKTFGDFLKKLPETLEKIWKEEALPLWQKMYNWGKNIWDSYIWPEIGPWFKKEIEKRKPLIEEEFKKEKEEIKEEVPKVGKSLWERFKELIK